MCLPFPPARTLGCTVLLCTLPAALPAQGPLQHWSPLTQSLSGPQAFAAGAELAGRIWVIGGESSGQELPTVRLLDGKSGAWSSGPALAKGRTRAKAGVVGTRLLVAGGRLSGIPSASMVELVQGKWVAAPSMKLARASYALAFDASGLYALGGRTGSSLVATKACERFDPVSGRWSTLPDMPGPRFGHGAHLAGGKIYVFGGFSSSEASPLRSTWVYELAKKQWTVESSLADQIRPHGYGTSYVDFSGQLILLGGAGSTSSEISGTTTERLDLGSNSPRWFACTPARLPIQAAVAGTVSGRTFLIGGAHSTPSGLQASTLVQELSNIVLTRTSVSVGPGFPYPVDVVHPPLAKGTRLPVLVFEPGLSEVPANYSQLRDQLAALGFFVMCHNTSVLTDPDTFSKVQVQAAQEVSKSPVYGPYLLDRVVFGGFSAGGGGSLISAGTYKKTSAVFALAPWTGCIPPTTRCGTKSPVIAKAGSVHAPAFVIANQGDQLGTKANTDWIVETLVNNQRFRVSYVFVDKDHGGKDTGQGFADTHAKTLPEGRALQERLYRYVLSFLEATVLDSPADPGPLVMDRSGEAHARWLGAGPRMDPAIQRTVRSIRSPELFVRIPGGSHAGADLQVGMLGQPSSPALLLISGGSPSRIPLGVLGEFLLDFQTLVVVSLQLPASGLLELHLPIPAGLSGALHFQSLGLDDAKLPALHLSGWRRSLSL